MATNFVQNGMVIPFVAGAAYSSGDVVVIGANGDALLGIVVADVANTATGQAIISGVVTVTKASAAVIAAGERVQWDASASNFDDNAMTPAAGDVTEGCTAIEAAGNGVLTVKVLLTPGTGVLN